jgi:SAM-dependent methyltransferase
MAESHLESLPSRLFDRVDNSADAVFYQAPRLVAHIDEATIAALTKFYGDILFDGADVLDLMSSWISHLPAETALGRVAGLGMNMQELKANPRLTEYLVQDLNVVPRLTYADVAFDFVFIAVSIQYLVRPIEVFAEIGRILRPGGQLVVAMSHRCFPTKAIRGFQEGALADRIRLISEYMNRAAAYNEPVFVDCSPKEADPLWLVTGTAQSRGTA